MGEELRSSRHELQMCMRKKMVWLTSGARIGLDNGWNLRDCLVANYSSPEQTFGNHVKIVIVHACGAITLLDMASNQAASELVNLIKRF
jgi:hypothetical protein